MKRFLFPLFLILFLFFKAPLYAETIKDFNAKITVNEDGTVSIVEDILYDFEGQQRHGIFRNIPLSGNSNEIEIKVDKVLRDQNPEPFSVSGNDAVRIKIGDPNKTISGPHSYSIIYKVGNSITHFKDHDELYWNVTGNDWEVSIQSIKASVSASFPITRTECFTGSKGSSENFCTIDGFDGATQFSATNFAAGEGLTIVAAFPADSFPKTAVPVNPKKELPFYIVGLIVLASTLVSIFYFILLPALILRWYLRNKKKKKYGPPFVNFDIPKDQNDERLLPAEAGTVDTSVLDKNDVIGTIFDLAIRKFIRIENKSDNKKDFTIKKLRNYKEGELTTFEKNLFDRLFQDADEIILNELSDFYVTFGVLQNDIFIRLIEKGLYAKNPKNQRAGLLVGGIFALFSLNLLLGIVLIYLAIKLNGRTEIGDEVDWKIDGLKLFLKSMNRNYKWHAEQLAMVEQMIPYAISLGFINQFMDSLKTAMPDYNPSWYSGRQPFYLISSNMFHSFNSGFTTTSPSSGFSGGSSGGGGGGGGGGSW